MKNLLVYSAFVILGLTSTSALAAGKLCARKINTPEITSVCIDDNLQGDLKDVKIYIEKNEQTTTWQVLSSQKQAGPGQYSINELTLGLLQDGAGPQISALITTQLTITYDDQYETLKAINGKYFEIESLVALDFSQQN